MISINLLRISADSAYLEFSVSCPVEYVFNKLYIKKYDYVADTDNPEDNGWRDMSHILTPDSSTQVMRISTIALSKEFNNGNALPIIPDTNGNSASTMYYVQFGVAAVNPAPVVGETLDGYTIATVTSSNGGYTGLLIGDEVASKTWIEAASGSLATAGWQLPTIAQLTSIRANRVALGLSGNYWSNTYDAEFGTSATYDFSTGTEGSDFIAAQYSYFPVKTYTTTPVEALSDVIGVCSDMNHIYTLLKDDILNMNGNCISPDTYKRLIRNYLFVYGHVEAMRLERFDEAEMYYDIMKKFFESCYGQAGRWNYGRTVSPCNCSTT